MNNKPMLNAYPDSLGGKLSDIAALLKKKEMQDTFSSFYILPSLYHSDLDRGFSVVDYNLNEELATIEDLSQIKEPPAKPTISMLNCFSSINLFQKLLYMTSFLWNLSINIQNMIY